MPLKRLNCSIKVYKEMLFKNFNMSRQNPYDVRIFSMEFGMTSSCRGWCFVMRFRESRNLGRGDGVVGVPPPAHPRGLRCCRLADGALCCHKGDSVPSAGKARRVLCLMIRPRRRNVLSSVLRYHNRAPALRCEVL